jgi:Tol biopolymer transport system component/predicted Ser/Thr protein kinase
MGEVYRARDSHLKREVAIKVLPAAFSRDPERLRRFQQEAQAVAALNHPNILAIHQLGEHEGSPYIVMEYLEGETLRTRLREGALPVRKSIELAEQLAIGLAAAHDKGVVHRDLKPENIFVTRDGRVKILDFGLAKLRPEAITPDAATLASQTEPGVVMGTAGYMSPEQVRGQPTDHRSDLFSLGAILYEMLTGKRAFQGGTSVEIMNAILKEDPPEETEIARSIPPALGRIVGHCLEKNPAERFQSARDVAFALGALSGSVTSAPSAMTGGVARVWWPRLRLATEVTLAAIVIALTVLVARHPAAAPQSPVVASILPPPGDGFWTNQTQPAAISPNGKFLALIAMRNAQTQLWLARTDSAEAQPIAGSEDAANPFWSPDSRYIGFFAGGKLKKVDVAGGIISDLCTAGLFTFGGAWSSRGVILFAPIGGTLKRVSDAGGTPEAVSGVPLSGDAVGEEWPVFFPDGNHFFYLEWGYPSPGGHENAVFVGSLDGEKTRRLPLPSTNVQYSSGYLLFSREGDLFAQEFDTDRIQLKGVARPIARNVQYDTFFDDASFTVSNNGILVYGPAGTGINSELTWMDRNGNVLGGLGEPGQFELQAISPDGKRVAVGIKPSGPPENIWIYDVDRGTRVLLAPSEKGAPYSPRWSSDGKQVAYRTSEGKTSVLNVRLADGSGEQKQIGARDEGVITVEDWSRDGRLFAITLSRFRGAHNWQDTLQLRRADGDAKPELEINDANGGRFSPDGHWLAYAEETSGEVYVTPFPGPGGRIAVSSKGGYDPRWRGDGQELYYVANDSTLFAVQLRETQQRFQVLSSKPLFHMQLPSNVGYYDVTRDGKRFLVNVRTHKEQTAPLTVVTNWLELLRGSEIPKN